MTERVGSNAHWRNIFPFLSFFICLSCSSNNELGPGNSSSFGMGPKEDEVLLEWESEMETIQRSKVIASSALNSCKLSICFLHQVREIWWGHCTGVQNLAADTHFFPQLLQALFPQHSCPKSWPSSAMLLKGLHTLSGSPHHKRDFRNKWEVYKRNLLTTCGANVPKPKVPVEL